MPRPWPNPRPSMVIVAPSGTSTGSSAIAGAAVATRTVTVAAASRPSMGPPERSDVVEPASSLRDRATHRRVHGKRLGKLVGRQRLGHRDRDGVDQLAGARAD